MATAEVPATIAGIPTERLAPMGDGSVREYDRPVFTEIPGIGRSQDPEARRVRTHAPGSEVAEQLRPIVAERNKPRPVTRLDIAYMEQARDIYAAQGMAAQASSCERRMRRMRAGLAISARRHVTGAARERRGSRSTGTRASSRVASRAGPSELAGGDEPPGEPEQLDLTAWLADRERVLAALIARWRA